MTDPALEALWKRVLDEWEDDRAHGAFMEYCQKNDDLLEGAVRYRGMSGDHVRGESAERRLKAIALLAIAGLESQRTPEKPGVSDVTRIVLVVFFIAATVALAFVLGH
ncbi:MAG TPA: hypothetical protein VF395_18885 [Polyangiaceae bacterium]